MRTTILALTLWLFSSTLGALELHTIEPDEWLIGEEQVEIEIVGSTNDHYLATCDGEKGFHLGAEKVSEDTYKFTMYCGPAPLGQTKYIDIRDTGI